MQQAKQYTIKDFTLHLMPQQSLEQKFDEVRGSEKTVDFRGLVSAFNYIESVESPSIRCEFMVTDTIDLLSSLTGNEIIEIELETPAFPGATLKIEQEIFKIGEVIKQERAVTYILYTVSPTVKMNEMKRVFKSFVGNAPDQTVEKVLKDYLQVGNSKRLNIEGSRGNFNFISPSWRPFDVISYITDKIVSKKTDTAGYLFFENNTSINFVTMDALCREDNKKGAFKYTYEQANIGTSDFNSLKIESLTFPDRANHLEKMRTGTYSNTVIGIKAPAMTSGNLPAAAEGAGKKGASGSIQQPVNMNLYTVYGLAKSKQSILNVDFPYPKVDKSYFSEKRPSRMKIRALPGMKNSSSPANPTAGAYNMDFDTVASSAYSFSRWQLLNAITLDIKVPGNVHLEVGKVIEIEIPASQQKSQRVEEDATYSGYYLIKGLRHSYTPEGLTTYLNLCKDSI